MRILAIFIVLATLLIGNPAEAQAPGRWVDFGKWNGVVACEASPTRANPHLVKNRSSKRYRAEVRADALNPYSGTKGSLQFMQGTWNAVAQRRGISRLVGDDPRTASLATTMRQAQWLRRNVGLSQWSCGYRYGDGTGPRYVTGERRMPAKPKRCSRNLHDKHGLSWSVSRSVCGVL